MAAEQEHAEHIVDPLEGFGHCAARRMFGGHGVFRQGSTFGPIADGNSPFSYYRKERGYQLSRNQPSAEFFEVGDACRRYPRKRKRSK